MKLEDVKQFWGETGYAFNKSTKMHHASYRNWSRKGYIPIKTQMYLELLSGGVLKASLGDLQVADDD